MAVRLVRVALPLETAAGRVGRMVAGRGKLEHGAEFRLGLRPAPDPEVRDPERLADRGLVRLEPICLLQRHGRLRSPPPAEVAPALLEEVIRLAHGGPGRR